MLARGPVLVLGAGGQLGRELCAALRARGAHVVAAARDAAPGVLAADLARDEDLLHVVAVAAPAAVLNAAAYTAVDRAEDDPEAAARINAHAPGVIARACARAGALLVHFSTDYVFDGRSARAWRETDRAAPLNEYGRSKLDGERAVADSGAAHLVLRTSWLYAPGGRNFATTMLRLFREPRTVRVVDDQHGSPTCARHLAAAVAALFARADPRETASLQGLYHLCAAGETTWHGFARALYERAQPPPAAALEPIDSARYGAKAKRPARSTLDCTRARERLGVALPHWREQLESVMPELNAAHAQ